MFCIITVQIDFSVVAIQKFESVLGQKHLIIPLFAKIYKIERTNK